MSLYFYLSYAAAEDGELLRKFFEDLSSAVEIWLNLSGEEKIGFLDPKARTNAQGGPPEVAEALQNSRAMIAMVSPNYFQSEIAGKEWQIFETRRGAKHEPASAPALTPPAIIPVIWIPCDEPPQTVKEQALYGWDESHKAYHLNGLAGLMTLRRTLPSFADEYVKVLLLLAEQIAKVARTVRLPPLDERPKAAIVEDNQQVRDMLKGYLSRRGYDCRLYWEAEAALGDIMGCRHRPGTFDVVLVDLELEYNKMPGLKLIERLVGEDDSPTIIAMSAGLSNSEYILALKAGADDVVPKPFALVEIEKRIGTLARIAQNRRRYRRRLRENSEPIELDQERERQVFLSYSSIDWRTATILRTQIEARGIGVWYAPDSLSRDDPILQGISDGLAKAQVFVPLVTDNYARSPWCVFEMATSQKEVIPVLEGYVHRMRNAALIRKVTSESVCDITFDRFADGFTLLLGRIQQAVVKNGKHRKTYPRPGWRRA